MPTDPDLRSRLDAARERADMPMKNTDRELWRETPDDYYSPSLHVTENGSIGINVGGRVIVQPASAWHALAAVAPPESVRAEAVADRWLTVQGEIGPLQTLGIHNAAEGIGREILALIPKGDGRCQ